MSNHSTSYALNAMVLKIIEGYINKEISENYVRKLLFYALDVSRYHDGNDHEVLEDVSNSFCGKCLKMKEGDFFNNDGYIGSEEFSLVKIVDSFFEPSQEILFKDISNKFNFSKEDISLVHDEFRESCTKALCVDCLKEVFDKITGSRDKTNEVMEYVYNNLR